MPEININFITNGKPVEWPTKIIINIIITRVIIRDYRIIGENNLVPT